MRLTAIWISILSLVLSLGCGKKEPQKAKPEATPEAKPEASKPPPAEKPASAVATLGAMNESGVSGTITFTDKDGKVEIAADISGLTPGDHGFHIHEKGDCSSPDGTSAGGHFNPKNVDHGAPDTAVKHVGDLGNITAGDDGKAAHTVTADWLTLGEGESSIAGRAVIVHEKADDFGQPTGNAGGRVACGVIELQ